MNLFRKAWAQIQVQFEAMSFATRALIVALVVILLAVGMVVIQYAAKPEMVALVQFASDRQPAVVSRLQAAGIAVEAKGSQIMVPAEKQSEAMAILAQDELIAPETSTAFDKWISSQNPWLTSEQNRTTFILAKQKVLAQIMAKMSGVRSADVILTPPEKQGFGANSVRPAASVSLTMVHGRHVDKRLVEAVAGLCSGAVSGMKPQDVVVIDSNLGRQFTVKSHDESAPGETDELIQAKEQYVRNKLTDVLSYIPGVIVAVNVRTDPTLTKAVEETTYEKNDALAKETSEETERRTNAPSGEAGVRPNVGSAIESGGATTLDKTTRTTTEYLTKPVVRRSSSRVAGQTTMKVSVTVNVPRSYFVSLAMQGKPADTAMPDEAALKPVIDKQLAQIEEQIKPLVSAESEGVVKAHMIPDLAPMLAGPGGSRLWIGGGSAGSSSSGGGIVAGMDPNWIKTAGLGLLALVSVGLMLGMVRRATQQRRMPSVEELAGVPSPMPVEDDMVGDVEPDETAIEGREIDENQLRSRKIVEQIGEMVKNNPSEAASIFSRWIRKEG